MQCLAPHECWLMLSTYLLTVSRLGIGHVMLRKVTALCAETEFDNEVILLDIDNDKCSFPKRTGQAVCQRIGLAHEADTITRSLMGWHTGNPAACAIESVQIAENLVGAGYVKQA